MEKPVTFPARAWHHFIEQSKRVYQWAASVHRGIRNRVLGARKIIVRFVTKHRSRSIIGGAIGAFGFGMLFFLHHFLSDWSAGYLDAPSRILVGGAVFIAVLAVLFGGALLLTIYVSLCFFSQGLKKEKRKPSIWKDKRNVSVRSYVIMTWKVLIVA